MTQQKNIFDPLLRTAPRQCQGTLFLEGNLTPIFEAKKFGSVGQKCQGRFSSLQFSPKSAIFGGFEFFFSKSDWNQRHIVYVTQIHYYSDHLWVKKCHINSIFKKFTFLAVLRGFGGHIEIPSFDI